MGFALIPDEVKRMEMQLGISMFDIVVAAICVGLLARGAWIGFSRQLAFLLALVIGFLVAGHFYQLGAPLFDTFLDNEQLRFLLAYVLILFLVYVAIMLLGLGLKKVMQVTFLGWFDRLMGGVFGLAKGIFLSILLFMLMNSLLDTSSPLLQRSFTVPYLARCAGVLLQIVRDENLRQKFMTIKPAIPDDLLPAQPLIDLGKPGGSNSKAIPQQDKLIDQRGQ